MNATWFSKNWMIIAGILAAIVTATTAFVGQPTFEPIPYLIAIGVAVSGYLGQTLKGQWLTLAGIIGVALITTGQMLAGQVIDWYQFIATVLGLVVTTAGSGGQKITP